MTTPLHFKPASCSYNTLRSDLLDPKGHFNYAPPKRATSYYLTSAKWRSMPDLSFDAPGRDQCFEDYVPPSVRTFGTMLVKEEEIIEFARRYDPQVFHADPVAARKTVYGGLVARGWHTAAMAMRLIVEHYLSRVASVGSPGADELRWLKPVRPGDKLSVRVSILEARRPESKPDRGVARSLVEVLNQDMAVVMSFRDVNILLCRDD
jgi:acyl dehydratase